MASSHKADNPDVENLIQQINRLSEIGRALSGEHDLNVLLEKICDEVRNFTHADACTLYIVKDNQLYFEIVQNHTMDIRLGGKTGEEITLPPIDLVESNVSAYVALKGVAVNIPDVYDTDLFDFTGPKEFDKGTGYRSASMLVCPMRNHEDDIIGVLQLVNAKDPETGEVIPFSPDFVSLTESLASQAAVSITNARLINDMENLFESFVEVMATAIDEKSPITGGHIRRVANLTMVMAEELHKSGKAPFQNVHFSPDEFHELKVASWMHDIGKVTTPVEIIEKSKKLETIFDRIQLVDLR
ncbi:MAG: GAF domain-containing protein, partial [Nitrospinaceae bacterium]